MIYSEWRFNPIQDGRGGPKRPPASFCHITSTNVRFSPQNFLTFSFNPFAILAKNFKFVTSASPKWYHCKIEYKHKQIRKVFLS